VDQFFDVFEAYNTAIWPAQYVAYILEIAGVYPAARDGVARSRILSGILALFWGWMGVAYHFVYFSRINPAARIFGTLFVLQGMILALVGCVLPRLRFHFTPKTIPIVGALFILYALVAYPLIGLLFGHSYPRSPVFGVSPCPATIFTFGLLLWVSHKVPMFVVAIPFLWCLIGVSAAINLHVPQDYGLGVAGILGTVLVFVRNSESKGQLVRAGRDP
jgi:hypothetical protein